MKRLIIWGPLALLSACSENRGEENGLAAADPIETARSGEDPSVPASPPQGTPEPVEPVAPGQPGGLPDDRTPVSEAPFAPESAQGAANVLQTYYALIEAGKYEEAWKLREPSAAAPSAKEFADSFARYSEYHAQVGAPSDISGAAGSLYVEVPVQTYGRMKDGKSFSNAGTVTLRRSNDVPGATAEQRRWRLYPS